MHRLSGEIKVIQRQGYHPSRPYLPEAVIDGQKEGAVMEIERKYTIAHLPENLSAYPVRKIEQGYLSTDPVVRVRSDVRFECSADAGYKKGSAEYYLTYKGSGTYAHEEYNLPLTQESYSHLLSKCDGTVITKTRYNIPISAPKFRNGYDPAADKGTPEDFRGLVIELDVFRGAYDGLHFAEVEFPTAAMGDAFIPPEWFTADVTGDRRFSNSFLSVCSDPQGLTAELMKTRQ